LSENQFHHDFPIDISDQELQRLLGYGERPVPDRVRDILAAVHEESPQLVNTASSRIRVGSDVLSASPFLGRLDEAVLCLVTIGDGLEKLAEWHDREGRIAVALITHVYGSAAVEAAADAVNAMIRTDVEKEGLFCSRRFSPGYGGWNVDEQQWMVPRLDGDTLGVTLTAGCMMIPRKSVTFAVSVGTVPTEMRDDNECDSCDLINCRYRRQTVINEESEKQWKTFVAPESNFCPRDRWS